MRQVLEKLQPSGNQPLSAEDRQRSLAEAEQWFRRAIEIDPKRANGYLGLGSVLAEQQKSDQACETLRQGIKESTDDTILLHDRLSTVLLQHNQSDEAAQAIGQLRAVTDQLIQRRSRSRDAAVSLKEAALLRTQRRMFSARSRLARNENWEVIRSVENVVSTWREVLADTEWGAKQSDAFILLSVAYGRVGERDRAALAAERAAELAADSAPVALTAAAAWKTVGNAEKVLEHYRYALSARSRADERIRVD